MAQPADSYRLPRHVEPIAYRLEIQPDLDAATFDGRVEITVDVVTETDVVVLNAAGLDITGARLGDRDLRAEVDDATERLHLHHDQPVKVGRHRLDIEFTGKLADSLYGFYRSTYADDDGEHQLGVTQFEAAYARRAFPCWDEPDRKATFQISLVCDETLLAVANAAETSRTPLGDGRVRIEYAPTIPMSTYLVAWVIGRLEATAAREVRGIPIRVVHRPGQAHLSTFALDVAEHSLAWFEDYYGIAYPGDKLDLVAVPDFAFGAMENLGCITFREVALLIDPALANRSELQQTAVIIAHEIAHMWFGDLVTMEWWDDLWLNEAFATLMETMCASAFRPDWDLWTNFAGMVSPAFETDALSSTRAIAFHVEDPDDIDGLFDVLTYDKGAAVLRMLEHWMGPDAFRTATSTYLHRHRFGTTVADDLWQALSETAGTDVRAVMGSWFSQGGHPLVTVSRTPSGVHLRQERQLLDPAAERGDATWHVPVRLRAGVAGTTVERSVLLDRTELDVDLGGAVDWVSANAGATGFYRTHHRGALDHLGAGPAQQSPAERATAIDNQVALLLSGIAEARGVIGTLRRVAPNESHPQVWTRISRAIDELFVISPPQHHATLGLLVDELTAGRWDRWRDEHRGIDIDELAETTASILRLGGLRSGRSWRTIALDLVERHDNAPGSVHPELVGPALEVVAAYGDETDFDHMLRRWSSAASPQDEQRAQAALAAFRRPDLAARFWEMFLAGLRPQDVGRAIRTSMANPATGVACWEFVTVHWSELTQRVPRGSHAPMLEGLRCFSDAELVERAAEFFEDNPISQGHQTLAQHLERARINVAARRRLESQLTTSTG